MTAIDQTRYEIINGFGPDERFVELWDRSLAPQGLAFEVIEAADGSIVVTGHGIDVPLDAVEAFLAGARGYLLP